MVTSAELLAGLRTSAGYAERVTASFLSTLVFLREQGGENQGFADMVGPELLAEYDSHRKQYDDLEDRVSTEGAGGESQEGQPERLGFTRDQFTALSEFFVKCSALLKDNPDYLQLKIDLTPEVLQIIKTHLTPEVIQVIKTDLK